MDGGVETAYAESAVVLFSFCSGSLAVPYALLVDHDFGVSVDVGGDYTAC